MLAWCAIFNARTCTRSFSWVRNRDYYLLTGKTSCDERHICVDTFNKAHEQRLRVFLVSMKAGGVGMNLTGANRVVIFEPSWNPSDESQAIGRTYRLSQTKPVYVYRLIGSGKCFVHGEFETKSCPQSIKKKHQS